MNPAMKKIGVLALQGDFAAHAQALESLGAQPYFIRQKEELPLVEGLIIPGGESTTLLTLIQHEEFESSLLHFGQKKPIFGTCAGAILMAKTVCQHTQKSFNWLDIQIERNAYGRQIDSCITTLIPEPHFSDVVKTQSLEAVFIRAPRILNIGPQVTVLAKYEGYPVLVEQGLHMAATFHPELTADPYIHRFFLEKCHRPTLQTLECS